MYVGTSTLTCSAASGISRKTHGTDLDTISIIVNLSEVKRACGTAGRCCTRGHLTASQALVHRCAQVLSHNSRLTPEYVLIVDEDHLQLYSTM